MNMDRLIVRAAQMIVFGSSVEEVHEALAGGLDSEDMFFLVYQAAKIEADQTAADYAQARAAMG